jgi:hypothetical protein
LRTPALAIRSPCRSGPIRQRKGEPNGIHVQARDEDGEPADPPTFKASVSDWKAGDPIHLGRRTLRVVDVRASEDPEENAVLIVHDTDK